MSLKIKRQELLIIFVSAILITVLSSGFFWIFWFSDWPPTGFPLRYMRSFGEESGVNYEDDAVLIPAVNRVIGLPFALDLIFWSLVLWFWMRRKKFFVFSALAVLIEQANIYLFQGNTLGRPETFPCRQFYHLLYPYVGLYKAIIFAGILSYIFWFLLLLISWEIIKLIKAMLRK